MQVELPSGPADGGAACLDKECISPLLPDLLNSAVDVGDARDEEQFQQKVHALPSPAGTAFSQKLAAVQDGVFNSAGAQGGAPQQQQQAQALAEAQQGQAAPAPAPAQSCLTFSPLRMQSAQQQQCSPDMFGDSLLHSAQLEIEQMIGTRPTADYPSDFDAVAAEWLNDPSSSAVAAMSASPVALTGTSRVGASTAGCAGANAGAGAYARSGSVSLGAQYTGGSSVTPPHAHAVSRLGPALRGEIGGSSRGSVGPTVSIAYGAASAAAGTAGGAGARGDGTGSGCGSNSSLLGSAGCWSASAAVGSLSGMHVQPGLWDITQQQQQQQQHQLYNLMQQQQQQQQQPCDPMQQQQQLYDHMQQQLPGSFSTLPPAPALRVTNVEGDAQTAAATIAAAGAAGFSGIGGGATGAAPMFMDGISMGMGMSALAPGTGSLQDLVMQYPAVGSNSAAAGLQMGPGVMAWHGLCPDSAGSSMQTGVMGAVGGLPATYSPNFAVGGNWIRGDAALGPMAGLGAGFPMPPAAPAAATATAEPFVGSGPRGYMQLLNEDFQHTSTGAAAAANTAAAGKQQEDEQYQLKVKEWVHKVGDKTFRIRETTVVESQNSMKGQGRQLPKMPFSGPYRPNAASTTSLDADAAAAGTAAAPAAAGTEAAAAAAAETAMSESVVEGVPRVSLPNDPVMFINLPLRGRSGSGSGKRKAGEGGAASDGEPAAKRGSAAAAAVAGSDAGEDTAAAAAAATASGEQAGGGELSGRSQTPPAAAANEGVGAGHMLASSTDHAATAAAVAAAVNPAAAAAVVALPEAADTGMPTAAGESGSRAQQKERRGQPKYVRPSAPPVTDATFKAQARACAQAIHTMLQRDRKRQAALNLVHQVDKFLKAGESSELPKPGLDEVKQLADSTEAICLSLSGEMLKQSAKIEHDKTKNPKSHSRPEDNFGHHAGHKGWIQCRAYGKSEEDEQAGRQAALAQAKREDWMAKEYKKQILACGDDVAAARKVFEDMRQELVSMRAQQEQQLAADSTAPPPCRAIQLPPNPNAPKQQTPPQQPQQQQQQQQAALSREPRVLISALLPPGRVPLQPGVTQLPSPHKQQQITQELWQGSIAAAAAAAAALQELELQALVPPAAAPPAAATEGLGTSSGAAGGSSSGGSSGPAAGQLRGSSCQFVEQLLVSDPQPAAAAGTAAAAAAQQAGLPPSAVEAAAQGIASMDIDAAGVCAAAAAAVAAAVGGQPANRPGPLEQQKAATAAAGPGTDNPLSSNPVVCAAAAAAVAAAAEAEAAAAAAIAGISKQPTGAEQELLLLQPLQQQQQLQQHQQQTAGTALQHSSFGATPSVSGPLSITWPQATAVGHDACNVAAAPAHMQGMWPGPYQPEPPFIPAAAGAAGARAAAAADGGVDNAPPQQAGAAAAAEGKGGGPALDSDAAVDAAAVVLARVLLSCSAGGSAATALAQQSSASTVAAGTAIAAVAGGQAAAAPNAEGSRAEAAPTAAPDVCAAAAAATAVVTAEQPLVPRQRSGALGPQQQEQQPQHDAPLPAAASPSTPAAAAATVPEVPMRRSSRRRQPSRHYADMVLLGPKSDDLVAVAEGLEGADADGQQQAEEEEAAPAVSDPSTCPTEHGSGDDGRDSDDSFDFSGDEQQAEERRYRVRGVRTLGLQPRELSLLEIRERFGMSQVEAARDLGVGITVLKEFCRKFNISRWPSRKIIQLQKLINDVQEFQAQDGSAGINTDAVLEQLRQALEDVRRDPDINLDGRIGRLSMAIYKQRHKKKKRQAGIIKQQKGGRGRGGGNRRRDPPAGPSTA